MLCINDKIAYIKLTSLSKYTGILKRILSYYKESNDNLYKASFNNLKRIAMALEIDDRIFLKNIIINREVL